MPYFGVREKLKYREEREWESADGRWERGERMGVLGAIWTRPEIRNRHRFPL